MQEQPRNPAKDQSEGWNPVSPKIMYYETMIKQKDSKHTIKTQTQPQVSTEMQPKIKLAHFNQQRKDGLLNK